MSPDPSVMPFSHLKPNGGDSLSSNAGLMIVTTGGIVSQMIVAEPKPIAEVAGLIKAGRHVLIVGCGVENTTTDPAGRLCDAPL